MTIFYFTATGNSLYVAKKIGGNLKSIPQEINSEEFYYEDDVIGVVFPVYASEPPKIVQKFLSKARMKAEYFFAIATYGMNSGNPFIYVQREAKKNGYQFHYTNCIVMVDNYLNLFDIKKEIEKLPQKKVEEKIESIISDINNKKQEEMSAGIVVNLFTKIFEPYFKKIVNGKTSDKFFVNEKCIKCGICANVCPVGNIKVKGKVFFGHKCEACYSCIHMCPENAIHLKNEKSSVRWINPEVTLKEIIDSNKQ